MNERETEINAEIGRLRGRIQELKAELQDLRNERAGIRPGDRVRLKGRNVGKTAIVDRVDHGFTPPWLYGRIVKAGGQPGARSQCLYDDWERVEA